MDGSEIAESKDKFVGLHSPCVCMNVVGIAINGSKRSKDIVRCALDKFVQEGDVIFRLIHVRPRLMAVPTEMGNFIPISQVRDVVVAAYIKEIEWQTTEMLLPYKKMCAQRKVEVEIGIVESNNVAHAIAAEIAKLPITKLVIGASRNKFTRKSKVLSSKISACAPSFCTIYAMSKGKLSSIRLADSEMIGSSRVDANNRCSLTSESIHACSSKTGFGSIASVSNYHPPSQILQRFQALGAFNLNLLKTRKDSFDSCYSRFQSLNHGERKSDFDSHPSNSDIERISSSQASCSASLVTDNHSWVSGRASTPDVVVDCSSSDSQDNINFELEKLRNELRHVKEIYATTQSEANDASRNLKSPNKHLLDNRKKLEEINVEEERAKMKAKNGAKEKEMLESDLVGPVQQYRTFTWEEIVSATSSFSQDLKIGMGGYGSTYKARFHHKTFAVKVLPSDESHKAKQFQRELEILSKINHPHLLLPIGACTDRSCLIYEYMEKGSLENMLLRRNGTPPIPWFERYRIAWEVASALVFLHSCKPQPIIHRDLKPENILLDHNLVTKIADIGLSTMLQSENSSISTLYRDSGPVGTLCYIDPEYQRTGLMSPKSDVYAFGMVILQLLTAKPAIALAHIVETAVAHGNLMDIVDRNAGNWPVEETKFFAELGLSCVELRGRDRPDLQAQVLPSLQRLKEVAYNTKYSASKLHFPPPPNHFLCPILKEVMSDPCVATDGYTYERKAIKIWLKRHDNSPITNLPLPSKNLIPSYTLLSAITEWKSKEL